MHFVFRFFDGALRFAVPSCIAVIMLVIGMQVIARATVGAFSWPEELSVMLMIWALMLASVYVLNERGHVGITVLVDRFGPRNAALVSAVMHLLIILFCVAVIYGAVGKVGSVWKMKTGALGVSRAIPNLAIPTSCALYIVVCVKLIAQDLMIWRQAV